jgi:hypothetical protein
LRRLEIVRFQAEGWQEPYESRGSRTVLRGTGGEIPPVYPTPKSNTFRFFGISILYMYPPIAFISPRIAYLEIVYSVCAIYTLAKF